MAQLALVLAAGVVVASGGLGVGVGAAIAGMALTATASYVGSQIDLALKKPVEGARLGDMQLSGATYGLPIPRGWGSIRLPGNLIWTDGIKEHETTHGGKGGGKSGGKSGASITYSYTSSFAVAFALGPAAAILKVYADGKLVFDANSSAPPAATLPYRFYVGSEDQPVDPLIASVQGIENTPAFRGLVYIVCEDVELSQYGNRLPSVTAEIAFVSRTDVAVTLLETLPADEQGLPPDYSYSHFVAAYDGMRGYAYRTAHGPGPVILTIEALLPMGQQRTIPLPVVCSTIDSRGDVEGHDEVGVQAMGAAPGSLLYLLVGQVYDAMLVSVDPLTGLATDQWGAIGGPTELRYAGFASDLAVSRYNSFAGSVDIIVAANRFGSPSIWTGPVAGQRITLLQAVNDHFSRPAEYDGSAGNCAVFPGKVSQTQVEFYYVSWSNAVRPMPILFYRIKAGTVLSIDPAFTIAPENILTMLPTDHGFPTAGTYDTANNQIILRYESTAGGRTVALSPSGTINWVSEEPGPWGWGKSRLQGGEYAVAGMTTIARVDLRTGAQLSQRALPTGTVFPYIQQVYDSATGFVWYQNLYGVFARLGTGNAGGGLTPLDQVVEDICTACGIAAADIDATALASDGVRGFLATVEPGRDPLAQLSSLFFFDLVETDGKLLFRKRGGTVDATIPYAKIIRRSDGSALRSSRQQAFEIPRAMTVRYPDKDTNQQQGTQRYARSSSPAAVAVIAGVAEQNIDTRMVMTADEAKTMVKRQLLTLWQERDSYSDIAVGQDYLALVPSDVVTLGLADGVSTARLRLIKVDIGADFTMLLTGVVEDASISLLTATGYAGDGYKPPALLSIYAVVPALRALPLLRDEDDTGGAALRVYLAASTYPGQVFSGAQYLISTLPAADYSTLGEALPLGVSWGTATVALPDCADPGITDWSSALVVAMASGGDALTTATWEQVLGTANACALTTASGHSEVLQFQMVEPLGNDHYRLTGLLRGRRGTEWVTGQHAVGDQFMLLTPQALRLATVPSAALNATRWVKVMGFFDSFDGAQVWPTVFDGRAEAPYAPCHIAGTRDGSDNLTITWLRRSRYGGEWSDGTEAVPLAEETEAYSLDVLVAGVVVRTIGGLTTPAASYSAAQQAADGITPGAPVQVRVFQISAVVGRGNPAGATI